jgi:hypothetical protein
MFVGRLGREKNIEFVIRAFTELRNIRREVGLVLVGDGPMRDPLKSLVTRLALNEATILAGSVIQAEIASHYLAADLFVFSSLTDNSRHRRARSHRQRPSCRRPQGRGVHFYGEEWPEWLSPAAACITCTICSASRRPVREPSAASTVFSGVCPNRPRVLRGRASPKAHARLRQVCVQTSQMTRSESRASALTSCAAAGL